MAYVVGDACEGCTEICEYACKEGAISEENNRAKINPELCNDCGDCANECPTGCITPG